MDNATYTRNALKTFSNKPAQQGLKRVASNLKRTHVMHAAFGLLSEMAETFQVLRPWLLGVQQLSPEMLAKATDELGDVGYFMAILAKRLKVKMPGSGKRLRLKNQSPAEALFGMLELANGIASLQKKNFYGPVLKVGTAKAVVDVPPTEAKEAMRAEWMADTLRLFIPLYWMVVTEVLNTTPSVVFAKNIAKLQVRYPDGFFSSKKEAAKNPEAELAAQA